MRIKFIKPDPRAGSVAELSEDLAHRFIDEGRAQKVSAADAAELAVAIKPEPMAPAKAVTTESVKATKAPAKTVVKKAAKR